VRLWLGLWLVLAVAAGADVPLRLGHSGGGTARLAAAVRWELGREFHVTVAGPGEDARASDDLALLRATLAGDFHLAWIRSSALANFHRPWGVLSIPYLFPGQTAGPWMQGGELVRSTQGQGLRALTAVSLGERLLASRQPLRGLAELRQRRVQVARDRFRIDLLQELQAEAVASLNDDASVAVRETNVEDYLASTWQEQYPYALGSGDGLEYAVLVANELALERLQARDRARLLELSARASALWRWGRPSAGTTLTAVKGPGSDALEPDLTLFPPRLPAAEQSLWRERLKPLRLRSLRLIGKPWSELFP